MDVHAFIDVNAHADRHSYAYNDGNRYAIADADPTYEYSSTGSAAEYTGDIAAGQSTAHESTAGKSTCHQSAACHSSSTFATADASAALLTVLLRRHDGSDNMRSG
jgi:hypothetical protein